MFPKFFKNSLVLFLIVRPANGSLMFVRFFTKKSEVIRLPTEVAELTEVSIYAFTTLNKNSAGSDTPRSTVQ
jgi:hypothetical protein